MRHHLPAFVRRISAAAGAVLLTAGVLPAATAQPAPAGDRLSVGIVGSGPGRLAVEVIVPGGVRSVTARPDAAGRMVVEIVPVRPVELPWARKELGTSLLDALELARTPASIVLTVTPGPAATPPVLSRRPDGARIVLAARGTAGSQAGAGTAGAEPDAGGAMRVVIDPGHGGEEDGAIGSTGLKEKDVVLDIARRLAARLRAAGFDVRLTRDGDENLSLDERAGIANENHADLFVSLHVNASRSSRARGAETYILSREATDDAARTLAALENDAAGSGLDGRVGDSELPLILWDLAQVEYLEASAELAATIQRRLNEALGLRDRGVRQAPFRVLVGATCPAVLVETGFMSHPDEERKLADGAYRARLADVLAQAISEYRQQVRDAVVTLPERRP